MLKPTIFCKLINENVSLHLAIYEGLLRFIYYLSFYNKCLG